MSLSFDNTQIAFKNKSNSALKQAHFLFKSMGNPWLTKIGVSFTTLAFKLHLPIKALIRNTIFKQFCGGETIHEASITAEEIYNYGVGVILDYGVEGKTTEDEFNHTAQEFIKAIEFAKGKEHIPFISIKVTGFARFALLEKLDAGKELNQQEQNEYKEVEKRMHAICKAAVDCNKMILVDAEETWVQDPVDSLANHMMLEFNISKAFIFNTYQMYRHDRVDFLNKTIQHAKDNNYILGAKLVRGAYMEKERKRAEELNYNSPIQPNKEACDIDYDAAVHICLQQIKYCHTFIGTHNELSCYKAVEQMKKQGIQPNLGQVYFSQLYGMSDNISFNLASEKYLVSKYLPYGPVHDVIPYLMRRAQENTSVAGQTGRELGLITKELKRRKSNVTI
jgi:proline dehydrogenase